MINCNLTSFLRKTPQEAYKAPFIRNFLDRNIGSYHSYSIVFERIAINSEERHTEGFSSMPFSLFIQNFILQ